LHASTFAAILTGIAKKRFLPEQLRPYHCNDLRKPLLYSPIQLIHQDNGSLCQAVQDFGVLEYMDLKWLESAILLLDLLSLPCEDNLQKLSG
jgi:hypothetical protein